MAKIKIGADERTVPDFTGRKAFEAMRIITRITKKAGDISEMDRQFSQAYRDAHPIRITRAMARMRFGDQVDKISEEDWQNSGQALELGAEAPSQEERFAHLFPTVFEAAEDEVLKLVALVLVPNGEFSQRRREGRDQLNAWLLEQGEEIADLATTAQLVEAFATAYETVQAEVQASPKARQLLAKFRGSQQQEETDGASTGTRTDSSTGSPAPTTGESETSSTTSPSAVSTPSPA